MNTGFDRLHQSIALDAAPKVVTPTVTSFREFLEKHARVKTADGTYRAYTFEGREALEFVVGIIDRVIGSAASGDAVATSAQHGRVSSNSAYNGEDGDPTAIHPES